MLASASDLPHFSDLPHILKHQLALSLRNVCFEVFKKIQVGRLTFHCEEESFDFGDLKADLHATITVKSPILWTRLALLNTLGLGEGYMEGDYGVDDLAKFLYILAVNRDSLSDGRSLPKSVHFLLNNAVTAKVTNSLLYSRKNIAAHYDLGNDMFEAFLDSTMTYSCPIWCDNDSTLEQAQMNKIHAILDKACIRAGDVVLEIGTGWGALAIEAVKRHQCKVVTITLSMEQKVLAEDRIKKAGLCDSITVLLQDYRTLDPISYTFDRIISVEMLEAVGPEFLATFFKCCNQLLKPLGVISLQVITMPESRYESYCRKTDFIQKHIFPGGHCPSFTALVEAIHQGSEGQLIVDLAENIGPHYAKALSIWRERFLAYFDAKPCQDYDLQVFKRKWEFYFAYCEIGFSTRTLGTMQIRLTRANNFDLTLLYPSR